MLLDLWLLGRGGRGGWECEGAIPMLFLAYPRDDVDVCFVTDSQRSGSDHSCVVSARIPGRASLPCFCVKFRPGCALA